MSLGSPVQDLDYTMVVHLNNGTLIVCQMPELIYVSPLPDPRALQIDALLMDWTDLFTYTFPPWSLPDKVP